MRVATASSTSLTSNIFITDRVCDYIWSFETSPSAACLLLFQSIAISMSVCLCVCVCLLVCLSARISPKIHYIQIYQFFILVTSVRGSVLFWREWNTLCTSGFVDDAMFSHNEANEPELKTTRMFRSVWLMAAPRAKSAVSDCIMFTAI